MLKVQSNQKETLQQNQLKMQRIGDVQAENQEQHLKKSKKQKITKKASINTKMGHWNFQQKLKYVIFVENNAQIFSSQHISKLWKLFKQMSEFINTRDPYQSRSHHQKMAAKFYNIDDMIECLKSSFSQGSLRKAQRKYLEWLQQGTQEKNGITNQKVANFQTPVKVEQQKKSKEEQKEQKQKNVCKRQKNDGQINYYEYKQDFETAQYLRNELENIKQKIRMQLQLNSMLVGINPYNFHYI